MDKNQKPKNIHEFIKNSKELKETVERLKRKGLLGEALKGVCDMFKDS